jgi:hypothetical protein
MKLSRILLLFCLLLAGTIPAFGVIHMNTDELVERSDVVILGEVVGVDQDMSTTHSQIRVLQPFKGQERPGALVTVESKRGKVYIDESEPDFMIMQIDLLFLQKTPAGTYICVNRGDGQKIVRNDNLYPFHDNASYSIPLKDYLKTLEAMAKQRQAGQAKTAQG